MSSPVLSHFFLCGLLFPVKFLYLSFCISVLVTSCFTLTVICPVIFMFSLVPVSLVRLRSAVFPPVVCSLVCPCVYLCLQSPSYSAVCSVNWFSFLYSLVQFCFLQVWQKNCYCCFHIQSHNCKKVTTSISVSVIDICIHLFIYFQFWLEITLWSLWLPTTPKQ